MQGKLSLCLATTASAGAQPTTGGEPGAGLETCQWKFKMLSPCLTSVSADVIALIIRPVGKGRVAQKRGRPISTITEVIMTT